MALPLMATSVQFFVATAVAVQFFVAISSRAESCSLILESLSAPASKCAGQFQGIS